VSLTEAGERIKGFTGSYDLAVRDLLEQILAGELKSAAALVRRKSPRQRLILKPAFWKNLEIWQASLGQPIRVSGTVEGKPLGTFFNWAFFIRRADLDKLYPVAPPTRETPLPTLPPRRKPPSRTTKDWRTVVARELIRCARAREREPTASQMCEFCELKLGWEPDISLMRRLLRRLLG
jgi:hypothetical protein